MQQRFCIPHSWIRSQFFSRKRKIPTTHWTTSRLNCQQSLAAGHWLPLQLKPSSHRKKQRHPKRKRPPLNIQHKPAGKTRTKVHSLTTECLHQFHQNLIESIPAEFEEVPSDLSDRSTLSTPEQKLSAKAKSRLAIIDYQTRSSTQYWFQRWKYPRRVARMSVFNAGEEDNYEFFPRSNLAKCTKCPTCTIINNSNGVKTSESLKIWHDIFLCHPLRPYMMPTLY